MCCRRYVPTHDQIHTALTGSSPPMILKTSVMTTRTFMIMDGVWCGVIPRYDVPGGRSSPVG